MDFGWDKNSWNFGNDNNYFHWCILVVACAIVLSGCLFFSRSGAYGNVKEISYPDFQQYLAEGGISKEQPMQLVVTEGKPTQALRGAFKRGAFNKEDEPGASSFAPGQFRTTVFLEFNKDLRHELASKGYKVDVRADSAFMFTPLMQVALILFIMVILYFFLRQQIRNAGRGARSFLKSKARTAARDRNRVMFKDVAGVEEAKEEVQEIVEFLKDPSKFQKLGGRIPKGVLMVGPPGTGKTLLARAIAGEANVPFFSISGSDFVEMFVGVGASRVRDMFEQGKKSAPCIIFIDEIDAVGRHRGHGLGGGRDEREHTLNALLVELDGFDTQEGVIIIAATNRPDVLDPALLRPGRFDRQITVTLPDVKGREEILRIHAKRVALAEGVDLAVVARGTAGYSGAELANLSNEAALLAARRGIKEITLPELEEARDRVRWGKERRSLTISEKEKENTAYHEAGHALLCELLDHTDPVHKVTIIPRGPALGSTMSLPVEDKYNNRKDELLERLVVIMGGRVAEEMIFGDATSRASGDIRMATEIAHKMVCEWGMSERLGMVEYGEPEDEVFLERDIGRSRGYSEATAQGIDSEVKDLCDDAYGRARKLLTQRKESLIRIAKALLQYESLDGSQVRELINHGELGPSPISSCQSDNHSEKSRIPRPQGLAGLTEVPV